MAPHHGSLADDWGDFRFTYEEPPASSSRRSQLADVPLEAQQILADYSFLVYPRPSPADIDVVAYNTWHSLSEHSDPASATAPLHPLEPISVQSDTQFNSSWVGSRAESVADSGFFSNTSTGFSTRQRLDSSSYSAPSFPHGIGTASSLDVFTQQTQPDALLNISESDPWYPGSRLDQPYSSVDTIYDFAPVGQHSHSAVEYGKPTHSISEHSESTSLSKYQDSCTVSSEALASNRSRTDHTVAKPQGNVTICDQCGAQFTGRYQRGNCARHVRQQHAGNSPQLSKGCICRVCKKRFNRQDARRKHEWKKHQLQDTKPLSRRQAAGLECDTSHVGTHDTGSNQGTLTCTFTMLEEPIITRHYRVPTEPQQAYDTFAMTKAKLADDDLYDLYCQVFLARCARIVEELRKQKSGLHDVFSQELHDLSMQMLPYQHISSGPSAYEDRYMSDAKDTAGPEDDKSADASQDRGKAPASRRTSHASSRFDPYAGRPSRKSEADPIVAISKEFEDPQYQELDCPIHKWHLMHARVPPCNGCGKPYMNGVRQHLLPSYSQQHQGKITFIQRCKTCAEDFVDKNLWDLGRHGTGACHGRSQPQGHSLICWARLYLKIYSEETRIPSPYRNDQRLLPDDLVALLREDLRLPRIMVHNNQHAPLVSVSSSGSLITRQPELVSSDSPRPEQIATLDALISQAMGLLARFLAQEYTEAAHERIDVEDVEARIHRRLHELRQDHPMRPNQARQPDLQNTLNPTLPLRPVLHEAAAPVIGGAADFTTPTYQPNTFMGTMQVSDSDMGISHSSQGYRNGTASFGFPSFPASSQTDYDYGTATYTDHSQTARAHFHTPAEPPDCPPSPDLWLSPYEGRLDEIVIHSRVTQPADPNSQWLSPYEEAMLDMPGSSRMPQLLADRRANAQMMSQIEYLMADSPSEAPQYNNERVLPDLD